LRADEATTGTPPALAGGFHVLALYTIVRHTVSMAKRYTSIRLSDTAKKLVQQQARETRVSTNQPCWHWLAKTLAKKEGIRE